MESPFFRLPLEAFKRVAGDALKEDKDGA